MIRRRSASPFAAREEVEDDVNPMESVANLSDVMLVFAVALMLAIIARANLDFSAFAVDEASLVPIEDSESQEGQGLSSGGSDDYQEVGRVYRNSDGDMFILEG